MCKSHLWKCLKVQKINILSHEGDSGNVIAPYFASAAVCFLRCKVVPISLLI